MCYLAIKLEKFTKCPAGQIVKYKLNNKKKKLSRTRVEAGLSVLAGV